MVVNRSTLFGLELNEYMDININNASLEPPTSLLNKIEALDESSVCLKYEYP